VEFALILPLLLLILLGIIEFGIAVLRYNTVANVGREIARYGVVHPDSEEMDTYLYTDKDLKGAYSENILRWTQGLDAVTDTLEVDYTLLRAGDGILSSTVQVTVTYAHEFLTGPIVLAVGGQPTVSLRSVSTMYTETPAVPSP
jgi:Flp pilus assembly protein TadG